MRASQYYKAFLSFIVLLIVCAPYPGWGAHQASGENATITITETIESPVKSQRQGSPDTETFTSPLEFPEQELLVSKTSTSPTEVISTTWKPYESEEPDAEVLDPNASIRWLNGVSSTRSLSSSTTGDTVMTGWETLHFEGFEGVWPGPWDTRDNDSASGSDYWGDVNCKPGGAHSGSWTGWCADEGDSPACGANYDDNMDSWMIYGPFSLSGYTDAEVDFYYVNECEECCDKFAYYVSINGSNYYGYKHQGTTSDYPNTWQHRTFDLKNVPTLGNICGQSQVWFAVYFQTDVSVNSYGGAYVDDITILRYDSGAQADLTPYKPSYWNDKIPVGITQLGEGETHSYNGPYHSDQVLYFNWGCLNQGNAPASTTLVHFEVSGSGGGIWNWGTGDIPSGNWNRLTNDEPVGPLSAGTHTFRLWLDYTDVEDESDENNNYYERTITVEGTPEPDLTPYKPSHWNDKIPVGITQLGWGDTHSCNGPYDSDQVLYFNWASHNHGNATASIYCVHFEVTGPDNYLWNWCSLDTPPGSTTMLTNDEPVGPLSPGQYRFRVWLDYTSVIDEGANEGNNYYERTITVEGTSPPDIRIEPLTLDFVQQAATADNSTARDIIETSDQTNAVIDALDLSDADISLGEIVPDEIIIRFHKEPAALLHAFFVDSFLFDSLQGHNALWKTIPATSELNPLPVEVLGLRPFVSGADKIRRVVRNNHRIAEFLKDGTAITEDEVLTISDAIRNAAEDYGPIGLFYAKIDSNTNPRDICLQLMQRADVVYTHPSPVCHIEAAPNDPLYNRMWNLERIGMPAAWDISGNTLGGVRVCVVDTGVRISHNELSGRTVDQTDVYLGNGDAYGDGDENNDDPSGHGTSCAGIIAAIRDNGTLTVGIAPVTIIPVNGAIWNATTSRWDIANYTDGVFWGVDHGADVISLSLGSHRSSPYQSELNAATYAENHGVIVCAAAGNDDGNADDHYPSAIPYYICVAAVDDDDLRVTQPKWWWGSNFGNSVDICGLGQGDVGANNDSILTLGRSSNTAWTNTFNGTSAATPHVAGLCALLAHVNSSLTAAEIRNIIEVTAEDQIGDPSEDTPGWDQFHGHGLIYADAALAMATHTFMIYNDGEGTLTVTDITKENGSCWLSFSPSAPFDILGGGAQPVTVSVDSSCVGPGTYSDRLLVYSNDSDESPYPGGVYVNLTVDLSPAISVTPSSQDFGTVQVGSYADETFTVENTGGGTLTGSASVPSPFSIVSGGSYSLTTGQTQNVTVRFSPTLAQPYTEDVTFTGGVGTTRPVTGTGELVDSDGDGIYDYQEIQWGLDPDNSDTDSDGLTDGYEVSYDGDPNTYNPYDPVTGEGTDLNANSDDSDNDGLTDSEEINNHSTNPISEDTEGDGMPDGWEIGYSLNPLQDDSQDDNDNDGLTNIEEYNNSCYPDNPDSDDDGMPDGWEVDHLLNPLVDDADDDSDGDGYSNLVEFIHGSLPNDENSLPPSITFYVDDDAPGDPGPGDPCLSDPLEDGSPEHPFDAIQEALDVAIYGDQIQVAVGTYAEHITLANGVALIGEGDDVTTIDGTSSGRIVDCSNCDPNTVLSGFLITNGTVNGYDGADGGTDVNGNGENGEDGGNAYGGGMYCENSNLTISNCTFSNNTATGGSGGDCGYMDPWDYEHYNGNGGDGGSGYGSGIYCSNSGLTITKCAFTNNTVSGGNGGYGEAAGGHGDSYPGNAGTGIGGGIYCDNNSSPMITNCIFSNNNVIGGDGGDGGYESPDGGNGYGGGIYSNGSLVITSCALYNNTATGGIGGSTWIAGSGDGGSGNGGGLYCANGYTIANCIFLGNAANGGDGGYDNYTPGNGGNGYGGGLYCINSQAISNCTLYDNVANGGAGWQGEYYTSNNGNGGGLFCDSGQVLANSILWGNMPNQLSGHDCANISYCDIADNICEGINGNISTDPLFVDPDGPDNDPNTWEDNDYHLLAVSPCIDAGDPCFAADPCETDMDGDPRIINGLVDIGADEYRSSHILIVKAISQPEASDCTLTTIPEHIDTYCEGEIFYLELWAQITYPPVSSNGLNCVFTDVTFDDSVMSASLLNHCSNFATFSSGTIQPGLVDELGGCNLTGGLGIGPEWALIAQVEMTADVEGETTLSPACANTSCSIIGYGAVSCDQVIFESNLVTVEKCCIYDLDEDDFIGPGDLSLFACCWLHDACDAGCGGIVPCEDCDFDCDNFVGPGDLSWFATGWLKQCTDPCIVWPPCRGSSKMSYLTTTMMAPEVSDIEIRLVALTSPSPFDRTETLPDSIDSVLTGQEYYLEVWASDVGSTNTGLTSVYVDVVFDPCDASYEQSIDHGDIFTVFPSGTITASGIDELGGSSIATVGLAPEWARVAIVTMRARTDEPVKYLLSKSSTGIAALGRGLIPWSDVDLGWIGIPPVCGDTNHPYPVGDLDQDCHVELSDFAVFTTHWLETNCADSEWCFGADLDHHGQVDLEDLFIFVAHWLECTAPECN